MPIFWPPFHEPDNGDEVHTLHGFARLREFISTGVCFEPPTVSYTATLPHRRYPAATRLQMVGARTALNFLIRQHHTLHQIAFPGQGHGMPDLVTSKNSVSGGGVGSGDGVAAVG